MGLENNLVMKGYMDRWPQGAVYLSSWFIKRGFHSGYLEFYKKKKFFESVGEGALKLYNDEIKIFGALYALQRHARKIIHPAGSSALRMLMDVPSLRHKAEPLILMGYAKDKIPKWMKRYDWEDEYEFFTSALLPKRMGLIKHEFGDFSIFISGLPRAMMELIHFATSEKDMMEAFRVIKDLKSLDPLEVQVLLENCTSVKVKRLFLFMARKAQHGWYDFLDVEAIDLGSGKRSYAKGGLYDPEFQLVMPSLGK